MDITIEPWKKLIIHEIIEYKFDDWVKQIAFSTSHLVEVFQLCNGQMELFLHQPVSQLQM